MPLENLKKHQGTVNNTGARVAIVFRKIPNDDSSCLVVETDRLPESYHDGVIQALNSKESMETNDFYEVLNRRTFHDGTNCLTSLHQRGFLRKESIDNVTMLPLPGQPVPLALINATIDKTLDQYTAKEAAKKEAPKEDTRTLEEKNAAAELIAAKMQDPALQAQTLISRAIQLEAQAEELRNEAYAMAPELKPGKGRPALPEDLKARKLEERKEKRRERDRAKAAAIKQEKKDLDLKSRIDSKILRDAARIDEANSVK